MLTASGVVYGCSTWAVRQELRRVSTWRRAVGGVPDCWGVSFALFGDPL